MELPPSSGIDTSTEQLVSILDSLPFKGLDTGKVMTGMSEVCSEIGNVIEGLQGIGSDVIMSFLADLQSLPGFVDAMATHGFGWWATYDFAKMRAAQGREEKKTGSEYSWGACWKMAAAGAPNAIIRGDWINLLSQLPFLLGSASEYLEEHPELMAEKPKLRLMIQKLGGIYGVLAISAATGGAGIGVNVMSGEFQQNPVLNLVKVGFFAISQSGYALRESDNGLMKGAAHTIGNAGVSAVSFMEMMSQLGRGEPISHASAFWFLSSGINAVTSLPPFFREIGRTFVRSYGWTVEDFDNLDEVGPELAREMGMPIEKQAEVSEN